MQNYGESNHSYMPPVFDVILSEATKGGEVEEPAVCVGQHKCSLLFDAPFASRKIDYNLATNDHHPWNAI
jgi:hypothetical protein